MGYCIQMEDSDFIIASEHVPAALEAMKGMKDRQGEGHGGGSTGLNGHSYTCFSWMHRCHFDWDTIEEAFASWRFEAILDEEGAVDEIQFTGEKIGDEKLMFETIAPYVEDGSYLQFRGEDGDLYRYFFSAGKMVEQSAVITWK